MRLFEDLVRAQAATGRINGISLGIVSRTDDPEKLQRVQVRDMSKGGESESDWLYRLLPYNQYTPPIPLVGDLVVLGYIDGNPHQGVYLGVIHNSKNTPLGELPDFDMAIGGVSLTLTKAGKLTARGLTAIDIECTGAAKVQAGGAITLKAPSITLDSPSINFTGSSDVSINGKQIATVGAPDNRGDVITSRGW